MRSRGEQGTCRARQFPEFAVTTCVPFWMRPVPKSAPHHAGLQGWPLAGIWEPGFRGTFPPFPNWWGSLCAQAVCTNHVAYAEHLLSFWVLVCAWRSTQMTSPHRWVPASTTFLVDNTSYVFSQLGAAESQVPCVTQQGDDSGSSLLVSFGLHPMCLLPLLILL